MQEKHVGELDVFYLADLHFEYLMVHILLTFYHMIK